MKSSRGEKTVPAREAVTCPSLIIAHGSGTVTTFRNFFVRRVTNPHTRAAYARAWDSFSAWAAEGGHSLQSLDPAQVSGYVAHIARTGSSATANLNLAAVRSVCASFVQKGNLPFNPAASVATAPVKRRRLTQTRVGIPAVHRLLAACPETLQGLRDRALLAVFVYACAEASIALAMRFGDYLPDAESPQLRIERRDSAIFLSAHPILVRCLDAFISAAELTKADLSRPLFRAMDRRHRELGQSRLSRVDALRIVKARCAQAGIRPLGCRELRSIGVRAFLRNGGDWHVAKRFFGISLPEFSSNRFAVLDHAEIARIDS